MKTAVLAAVALTASVSSVFASNVRLACSAPVVVKGNTNPGADPVTSATINVTDNGAWTVNYGLSSGRVISRADQYVGGGLTKAQREGLHAWGAWQGTSRKNPKVHIVGALFWNSPGVWRYTEVIFDERYGESGTTVMSANCTDGYVPPRAVTEDDSGCSVGAAGEGLGAMASSDSRYAGVAILQGLAAGLSAAARCH